MIALRQVTLRYAPTGEPALQGVDLDLPRRGHTAIVGPSGAGKTTLLSLVLRFLDRGGRAAARRSALPLAVARRGPRAAGLRGAGDAGRARHDQGEPAVHATRRDRGGSARRAARGAPRREGGVAGRRPGRPADAVVEVGGQRQRIGLARALLRRPDVLLLDEATSQVDGLTEAAIHDCIRERSADSAVVTIAHRLSTVVDADTIVLLDRGRVRDRGTHAELLDRDELYRALVAALKIGVAVPRPLFAASAG